MCLMIWQPAETHFSYSDIEDFYFHNPDGMGVMYIEDSRVIVHKSLPRNPAEAWTFYLDQAYGRDCAIHFRMRTHGDIDMGNCHPYHVTENVYLMHNGVLHTGNEKDRTKSDTWHYIQDFLRPQIEAAPGLIYNQAWQNTIGGHIGHGNRFIIMSPDGHVIINKHHGVEYMGAWMSNAYAWSYKGIEKFNTQSWPYAVKSTYASCDGFEEVIDFFFDELEAMGYWDAYNRLGFFEVRQAAQEAGLENFYTFIEAMADVPYDEQAVIDAVKSRAIPMFELEGEE